jgi:predicted dehydrogenase
VLAVHGAVPSQQTRLPHKTSIIRRAKTHAILKSCGTELEIVCAVEPNLAAGDFCANNGLTLAASYDAALARADVDAVILATPHSLHPEQIDRGAAARKHIFCEKPLALTKADAERAVAVP